MRFNQLYPKILLLLGFIALILIYAYQNYLKELRNFQFKKLETYSDNFFAEGDPEVIKRLRPVSTLYKEAELITTFGKPFSDFAEEEWKSFWNIIYELYPIVEPDSPGLPKKVRQLSEGEIISELINLYEMPFRYFTKDHWDMFFIIILSRQ